LGNGITLPHLPKSATDIILKTGIEIYQFPDGVIWDRGNVMFIAIGVIAKEKEHIDVLKEIASIFSDELIANALSLISDKNDFLKILQHNALPLSAPPAGALPPAIALFYWSRRKQALRKI
jgi:mannitol/fructose-specific phosphotransferase system IIA component